MSSEPTEQGISFSKFFVILLAILLMGVGISGFVLPAPTKWKMLQDCDIIDGIVIEKTIEEIACAGELCYSEYSVVVEDSNGDNNTIYVSPARYLVSTEGGRFQGPVC